MIDLLYRPSWFDSKISSSLLSLSPGGVHRLHVYGHFACRLPIFHLDIFLRDGELDGEPVDLRCLPVLPQQKARPAVRNVTNRPSIGRSLQ